MPVRVLIVDDSGFFRRRLTEMLGADPRIEVVGTAQDGMDAVRKTSELRPDVITMDIEMPVMDGITATRRIMSIRPLPILMFSTLTHDGAKATLDALDAGAADFLPKKFEDIAKNRDEATSLLRDRVCALGRRSHRAADRRPNRTTISKPIIATSTISQPKPAIVPVKRPIRRGGYKVVAIGTSTGGPVALQKVLTSLPAEFPLPLLLVQHMPASFTPAFAQRLNQLCRITVKEASDGDALEPGTALLAPGGMQMVVEKVAGRSIVRIKESDASQNYRPCVDITFNSVSKHYAADVLAIIMTGMGADGREGVRKLKSSGATIWAQDEESCVIYGMPQAVVQAGLADNVLSLTEIGPELVESA